MNNYPTVTFIICHHNYELYLGDAIKSALLQTYPNIKICVIDDCSKNIEAVEQIIKNSLFINGFTNEDIIGNIRIWSDNKNSAIFLSGGPYKQAYARNIGIDTYLNETDFFAVLDADDIAKPNKIEMLIRPMLVSPHVAVTYGDYTTINDQNDMRCREFKEPYDFFRLRQECIVHSGALIRKAALIDVKENGQYFDVDLPPVEDYDLWLRLSEKFMFVHVPEDLTTVRVHIKNSTNTTTNEFRISKLRRIHEKIIQRENAK